MRTNIFCHLFKSRLMPQIASTLKSKRFPNSDLKTILGNITCQTALKIITTDKARTFNQYFAAFIFGKRHFLEYMNTCVILHWFKFVHKNSDQRKILEPSKISHSRQKSVPTPKVYWAKSKLDKLTWSTELTQLSDPPPTMYPSTHTLTRSTYLWTHMNT